MIKIISCFWNPGEYIVKSIESIKRQNYKNFKVFLVDDMSTDNSYNVALEAIDGDERFVLIKNTEKNHKLFAIQVFYDAAHGVCN